MLQEDHKTLIKKAKEEYRKIGYVECPAFSGERVYFNSYGFDHLIRKGREWRPINIQIERIKLLPYALIILRLNKHFVSHYKDMDERSHVAYFWSFIDVVNEKKIKIIVRQFENGTKHFFSIYPKSAQTSPK